MASIVVFAARLSDIVAKTRPREGIRWGGPADHGALLAAGAGAAMVDGALGEAAIARVAVAEEAGRIIGQNFYVAAGPIRAYSWLVMELAAGRDVFAMGGFVAPESRGRHLLADIKGFAARAFLDQGYVRMISLVDARNEASLRAHAHVGAVPLATLTRLRVGRLELVWKDRSFGHFHRGPRPFVFAAPVA